MASTSLQQAADRASKQSVLSSSAPTPSDSPNFKSGAYLTQAPMWELVTDIATGTAHVRALKEKYLPKMPLEDVKEYERRLQSTELFNGVGRTVKGLTGMVFRRDPVLGDDVPKSFVTDWENVDNAGTHGDVFSRVAFNEGLKRGHVCILVDAPPTPEGMTLADEQKLGWRPYWVMVLPENILSWRVSTVNGKTMVTQVVIRTAVTEPRGQFGEQSAVEYRVYRVDHPDGVTPLVTWQLWRAGSDSVIRMVGEGAIRNQTEVPLAVAYLGEKVGLLQSVPPLVDLAYTNIAHYQVRSDHRHSLHKASIPILVFVNRNAVDTEQEISVNVGIDVGKDGDVKYVEHSGSALGQTRMELKDLEVQMAAQGLAMLQSETRSAETAEAKRIDKAEQDSSLAVAARGMQDCLELAQQYHSNYRKEQGGSIKVNQDFESLNFDPAMIAALLNLHVANVWSLETLWDALEAGGIQPQDFDRNMERLRLALVQKESQEQAMAIADAQSTDPDPDADPDEPPADNSPPPGA